MYIKQVSRRGPSRPPCAVRPGPGWVGLARPALPCPTPAPTGCSVSGRAAEPGPGPQQEARWLVADPKAFAWFAAVPRGRRPSLLRGSVPGPATEQVRRVGWRVSFLPLFPRLVSFIAGVKWRWGEALLEPGLVRGLCGDPLDGAALVSRPSRRRATQGLEACTQAGLVHKQKALLSCQAASFSC